MLMLLIAKMQRYDEQCGERNNARAVHHCAAGELNGGSGRVLSLSAAGQDWTHQEEELHVEDEGFEDVEDQKDPTAHHPAAPSGKLPTHPAALRPVPSTPTKQSTPSQSATAAPPGTDPLPLCTEPSTPTRRCTTNWLEGEPTGPPGGPCLSGTTSLCTKPSMRRSSTNWLEGEPTVPPGGTQRRFMMML
ncbi:WW domain-binding protein 11-like isoform X2 [Anguilla anguilla]|uniref:WW domain-binding protein 11-like isoform X2 n=1 Tax=Anguilla anguilla TaxID=7936 RepID=UPI0015A972FF|nr:WW domain-binding protein 11-like isoform X2 [Anguilla anguilla]